MSISKTMIGLLIVAGGMAYYLYQNQPNGAENEMFIPELSANESSISSLIRVNITQGEQQFDLLKKDGSWVLNGGFYARMDTLFNWVQALKNARLIEAKTAQVGNFDQIGLTDEGLRVRLYSSDQLISDVVLGNKGSINDARFARYFGDNQSWLVSELAGLQASQESWQLSLILDVPVNRVQAIQWRAEETLEFIKNSETGKWEFMNSNSNPLPINEAAVEKLANLLTSFRINEAMSKTVLPEELLQTIAYGLKDGRKITIAVYQSKDDYFITVDDTQQAGRYLNWQFTVPDHKINSLLINHQVLTESKVADESETKKRLLPNAVELPVNPSS